MEFTSLGKRLVEKVWSWDNISLFCSHCNPCLFILCVHCVRWSVCERMRVLVGVHFKKILMGFLQEGSITKGIKSKWKTAGCRIRYWFVKNKHSFYNHRDRRSFSLRCVLYNSLIRRSIISLFHLHNTTEFLPSFKGRNSPYIIFKWDSDHPQALRKIQLSTETRNSRQMRVNRWGNSKTAVWKVHACGFPVQIAFSCLRTSQFKFFL